VVRLRPYCKCISSCRAKWPGRGARGKGRQFTLYARGSIAVARQGARNSIDYRRNEKSSWRVETTSRTGLSYKK
jgi:hypothetical protein